MRFVGQAWWLAFVGLLERPSRSAYLIATISVTVGAWLVLAAFSSPFLQPDRAVADGSVTIRNARSGSQMLPLRYAKRIAAISGVRSIQYYDLRLVDCPNGDTLTLNAIGGSGTEAEVLKTGFDPDTVRKWMSNPIGVLLSAEGSRICGWRAGTSVSPTDIAKQVPLQINIVGVAAKDSEIGDITWIHYEYVNRSSYIAGADSVLSFTVTADDPRDNESLANRIQKDFSQDDPPVVAYPDTVVQNARARLGKVQNLLILVMGALSLCCALVLVSSLAHSAAERRGWWALLLALGFTRIALLGSLVVESLSVLVVGAVLGVCLSQLALAEIPQSLGNLFGKVVSPAWAYATVPPGLVVFLLAGLVLPAALILRVHPFHIRKG